MLDLVELVMREAAQRNNAWQLPQINSMCPIPSPAVAERVIMLITSLRDIVGTVMHNAYSDHLVP